jgi:hypothetical protein
MKKPEDDKPPLTRADVEAILEIERQRAEKLRQLKAAILNGDSLLEHQLAREVVGLPKEREQ